MLVFFEPNKKNKKSVLCEVNLEISFISSGVCCHAGIKIIHPNLKIETSDGRYYNPETTPLFLNFDSGLYSLLIDNYNNVC